MFAGGVRVRAEFSGLRAGFGEEATGVLSLLARGEGVDEIRRARVAVGRDDAHGTALAVDFALDQATHANDLRGGERRRRRSGERAGERAAAADADDSGAVTFREGRSPHLEVVVGHPAQAHFHRRLTLTRGHTQDALKLHVRHRVTPVATVHDPRCARGEILLSRQKVDVQRTVLLVLLRGKRLRRLHDGVIAGFRHPVRRGRVRLRTPAMSPPSRERGVSRVSENRG